MRDVATDDALPTTPPIRRHRVRFTSLIILVVAALALLAFIGVLGDVRRQRNAVLQAERHAEVYAARAGETGTLPLNLEPAKAEPAGTKMISMEWLSADEARLLRKSAGRVIVAWTVAMVRALGQDGRAVIFFEDGRFDVEWVTLARFREIRAAQEAEIRRLARAR